MDAPANLAPRTGMNAGVARALVAILTVCLGLEAAARTVDPRRVAEHAFRPSAVGGFVLRPRAGQHPGAPVNRLGIRDAGPVGAGAPGETTILCIGDSMTAGGVGHDGAAWPGFLASQLGEPGAAAAAPAPGYRVINAAIEGYSIHQMGLLLAELAPIYQPEIVVLMAREPWVGVHQPSNPDLRWRYALYDFALQSYVLQTSLLTFTGYDSFGNWEGLVPATPPRDGGADVAQNLRRIARYAEGPNAHFLYVHAPASPASQAAGELQIPGDVRASMFRVAKEIPVLWSSETPELVEAGAGAWGEKDWYHLTEVGNEALAGAIAARLVTLGWIPADAPHG